MFQNRVAYSAFFCTFRQIKVLDPTKNEVRSLAGTGKPGFKDGTGQEAQLSEPNGLAIGENGELRLAPSSSISFPFGKIL